MPSVVVLLAALAGPALAACASVSDGCRKDAAECIKRCEATTDERDSQYEMLEPENTMTYCESKCGCRDPAPPKPQGKPTPTGNTTSTGTTP